LGWVGDGRMGMVAVQLEPRGTVGLGLVRRLSELLLHASRILSGTAPSSRKASVQAAAWLHARIEPPSLAKNKNRCEF
jgi:hypothetical protein